MEFLVMSLFSQSKWNSEQEKTHFNVNPFNKIQLCFVRKMSTHESGFNWFNYGCKISLELVELKNTLEIQSLTVVWSSEHFCFQEKINRININLSKNATYVSNKRFKRKKNDRWFRASVFCLVQFCLLMVQCKHALALNSMMLVECNVTQNTKHSARLFPVLQCGHEVKLAIPSKSMINLKWHFTTWEPLFQCRHKRAKWTYDIYWYN